MKITNLLLLTTLLSTCAHGADKQLLQCSTADDSIGAVDVSIKTDGTGFITVTQTDDSAPTEYKIIFGLKDLVAGNSATVIGQEKDGLTFGSASTKASLLRVLAGQKSAKFAASGTVYQLQCNMK